MKWVNLACVLFFPFSFSLTAFAETELNPREQNIALWDSYPENSPSLEMDPVQEYTQSIDEIQLLYKHFPRPGAIPVLLIHGLCENDRIWDSNVKHFSVARFLHSQGFDVWAANLRGSGTPGFRSSPHPRATAWSTDDYAIYDLPALVDHVQEVTGQKPFLIGHSLGALVIQGYLGGITEDSSGKVFAEPALAEKRTGQIRGVVTLAGAYNISWKHSILNLLTDPVRSADDYYHSNYELELLSRFRPLYYATPFIKAIPLAWVRQAFSFNLNQIPFIGGQAQHLYNTTLQGLASSPFVNSFYNISNIESSVVHSYMNDGMEDVSVRVLEQVGNNVLDHVPMSYYHLVPNGQPFVYSSVWKDIKSLPVLFFGGEKDRLTHASMIYEDAYLKSESADKTFISVPQAGHLDIVQGLNASMHVMQPLSQWLHQH